MFTGIAAIRNAKSKVKVKGFEHPVTEEMPLNHPEAIYGFITHCKLYPKRNQYKKASEGKKF